MSNSRLKVDTIPELILRISKGPYRIEDYFNQLLRNQETWDTAGSSGRMPIGVRVVTHKTLEVKKPGGKIEIYESVEGAVKTYWRGGEGVRLLTPEEAQQIFKKNGETVWNWLKKKSEQDNPPDKKNTRVVLAANGKYYLAGPKDEILPGPEE